MKKLFLLLMLTLVMSGVVFGQAQKDSIDETEMRPLQLLDIYENVSLIKLIANPEKYEGKRIQVIGYLHLEFEGNAIYLHEEDYKHSISENGFWVNFSDKLIIKQDPTEFNNQYVIIIGTFNATRKGHLSMFAGTFDNIVRLDPWNF